MFAIITFRNTGPIKTWSAMRAANVHNARTKPLAHAVPGAPEPEHLLGCGDLVADVKERLGRAGLDPDRLRKNGVIAYEAILTASPAFFEQGAAEQRDARLRDWTAAQVAWATKRYGSHRIASMVLHLDEKTPHIHLVVIPLELKADGRRNDGSERFGLVGRTISGPGRFDQLQDDYAAAMAPFGLTRGAKDSGRKHEPVPSYLRRLADKEREADELRVTLIRERDALAAQRAELDRAKAEMGRDHQRVLDAVREASRRNLAAWRAQAEAERLVREVGRERSEWLAEQEAGNAALASSRATSVRFRDDLIAARERLVPIFEAAKAFTAAATGLSIDDVAPVARPAVTAARSMVEVNRAVQEPEVTQSHAAEAAHAQRTTAPMITSTQSAVIAAHALATSMPIGRGASMA